MEAWLVDFQRDVKNLPGFFDLFCIESVVSGQLGLVNPLNQRVASLRQNLLVGFPRDQKLWSGSQVVY